jgi:itaconate CoA-transferase
MMYEELYRTKLTDAETAVSQIASGSSVALGMAMSQPPALMQALADRARAGKVDDVKLYYFQSEDQLQRTLLRYELMGRIKPFCLFLAAAERDLIKQGEQDGGRKVVFFVPNHFSQSIRIFAENIPIETFLVAVSPMDRNGYFTFGTNNDYTATVARQARRLIVEVNRHMPRVFGRSLLHASEADAIIEHDAPLPVLASKPITAEEQEISQRIAELVPERACLQMGIGGLPNAVCSALLDRKDLGIHTELLSPGLVNLIKHGVVTNRWKTTDPGKSVFTFAMGDQDFYDFIHDNPAIESHPVDYVNNPAVIAQNDRVVSVNATIEMDLTGACNSEYLKGHQYSATGGQLDFVRGAYASRGGVSIIAFPSSIGNGKISKIVPHLAGPVTTPRTDVQYVVTERGVANLKGLSSTKRAHALIGLAHPAFQEQLTAAAKEMHLI